MEKFKYDIVKQSVVKKTENMPLYFLANTLEEAEETYNKFSGLLNKIAYSYATTTGLHKGDLFGEALMGLAVAKRDWDPKRSKSFKSYAVFRIKDTLNEFVRNNNSLVSVPSYVKKSNNHIRELIGLCEWAQANPKEFIMEKEIPEELDIDDAYRFDELISLLDSAAKRAKVDYKTYVERVFELPKDVDQKDQSSKEIDGRQQEILEAALVVEKLKEYMDEEELAICDGIMADLSYSEIGKKLGKSKGWVSIKLACLRERIISKMKKGEL